MTRWLPETDDQRVPTQKCYITWAIVSTILEDRAHRPLHLILNRHNFFRFFFIFYESGSPLLPRTLLSGITSPHVKILGLEVAPALPGAQTFPTFFGAGITLCETNNTDSPY